MPTDTTVPFLTDMMETYITNTTATYPFEADFNWTDPLQIGNGQLGVLVFNKLGEFTIDTPKDLLWPAVKTGIRHPTGAYRGNAMDYFVQNRLTLEDVKALTPNLFEEVTLEGPCDRMYTMCGPYMAMSVLSKYHIAEGIDLCMGKTGFWGWDAAAAFDFLKPYDEAARRKLPDLVAQDLAWMSATDPVGGENAANLDACIARIEAATTAPVLIYGLAVANPQIGVTPANTARVVTLTGSSCRQATVICALASQPLHGTLTGTPPDLTYTPADGYQGMDRFTFTTTDGLTISAPATVHLVVGTGGTGLNGSYYDNMDFTSLKTTRIDPSVNFDWGTAPPAMLGAGTYSVRWTGQVMAPETGTYRFSTRTSDGVRLWVNGVQVINDWNDQVTSLWNDSAPITLTAGQKYSVKMQYYDNANPSTARLYWYMPSHKTATIIPQELLFPVTGVVLTSPSNGSSFAPGTTVALTADVADVADTVTSVSFYNGTTLIESDTTAPYAATWNNVATGEYALTARATTSTGAVSTSTVVVITVGGNAVPVTSGLACWFDASYGVTADADQQVTFWHDRSGNGHDAVFELWDKPVVMRNQLFSKPAIRFSDKAAGFLDLAGTLFVKEQYVVVRSPSYETWSYGGFLCHRSGRGSSYLLGGSGFESAPAAVSKNGTALASPFNLGTITHFMVLKITVDDNNTSPAAYQIGRSDGYSCEFDVTEILGYSRALTTQEQAKVGGYLTAKYGLTTAYPATGSLANRAATGITSNSAAINATLMCNGANYDVTAYWGTEDGGINPNHWANSAAIGSWTNVASIDTTRTLTNLAPGTTCYFTFRASNATDTIWATPAQSFTTLSTAKDLLTFGANVAGSSAVIDTGAGTVAWTVPYGTGLTNLAAAYTASFLAAGSPASGTSLNFSTPQAYLMTAQDGSTKTYTVTAILGAASPACDILTFGPGAVIDGNFISLTVPYETDLATLAPTYTVSTGATGIPASGVVPTPNFAIANPATYTITGQDGITTKTYYVTLTVLPLNPDRISNGGFEIGRDFGGAAYTYVNPGTADLPGWTGPANFSWYINGPVWGIPAQDGTRFMNLVYTTGTYPLSQSFAVTAGTVYTVSYYERIRGNGYMDATLSVAAGTVIGASGSPVPVAAGPATSIVQTTAVNANWTRHTFTFTPNTTTTATITLGNHYDGTGGDNDGVFLDNVSVTATVIVGPRVSTTTLTRHPGTGPSSTYGTALSFDVTVAGNFGTPVGTVTLKDGGSSGTTLGSATLTSGACTITTPTLALGTHPNIVAVYGGNSTYASSTSSPLSQTVISAPPDAPTGLTATPGASGAVMLTWNAPAGATGYKISIKNTAISAEQIVNTTASPYTATGLTNGTSYDFKVLGTNSAGDGAYSGVVSATPTAGVSTTTTLATLTPSTYGNPVIFSVTVAPAPTGGTLLFYDNNVALGSPVAVNTSTGVAEFTTSALTVGSHPITATFSGVSGFNGSTASPTTQTVNPATPVVTVTGTTNFTYNTSAQGPNTATTGGSTGAVTFSYTGVSGTTYPASGTAPTHVGSYTCTATVAADSNYLSASSGATPFAIAKATPVITWATPSPINVGTALGATQLNATSGGVAGNFVYTPASGVVLAEGSHPLSVQFTPTVTANYNIPAATTVTIQVAVTSVVFGEEQYQANGADPSPIGVASGDLLETAGVIATNEPGTISGGAGPALRSGSFGDYVGYNDSFEYATTYVLAPNTLGYDISEIRLFSNGGSRTGQAYDIKYSLKSDPNTFLLLCTYTDTLYGGAGGTLMTRTYNPGGSAIRTGVAAIQFVIRPTKIVGVTPVSYIGALYREWDVLGTATVGGGSNTYAAWAAAQVPPVTGGVDGDSNHDGVQNGIAYFMNDSGPINHPGLNAGNKVTWTNGGKIPKAEYGSRFVVQTSTTLEHWDEVPAGDPQLSNLDDSVSYTLPEGAGKVFVRLLVTP